MNASSVILISFITSVITAGGTHYLSTHLITPEPPAAEKEVVVPGLVGLTEADARANLRAAGLTLMVGGREPAADAPPETVIRQSLPAGAKVKENESITVTLAQALPKIPDVTGKSIVDATQALEKAGYAVQVAEAMPHESVEVGLIVSMSPKAGAELQAKRTVSLVPSAGPAAASVPKLVGLTLASAKINIQKAGFELGRVNWVELAERRGYLVVRQKPAAAEKAKPGAEINLVVNRGD